MGDYLHPSLAGYRVLADCLAPVLRRITDAAWHQLPGESLHPPPSL